MATLGPAERYESQYMGANEFLNRRLNEEFQRAFDAGIPSSAIYPSPEIYHIGTPSDRTTSEGFRSALSHGTSSVLSHPTSSPVSFGPSTAVQSASAAPVGLQSSPGGMSDVGSTLTPPGLPLRDPPRMIGSYGVSLTDPVFGISSGSIPCENQGHRPIPAQAPIPPPPPQQRVGDPVAQLLVGQGAMSHLLMQTWTTWGNTTWRKRTCEGLERDADVSPVSPFLLISLELCLVWFCGRCFVVFLFLLAFAFGEICFLIFTHSSC